LVGGSEKAIVEEFEDGERFFGSLPPGGGKSGGGEARGGQRMLCFPKPCRSLREDGFVVFVVGVAKGCANEGERGAFEDCLGRFNSVVPVG
jgi:hypothetical protein